jgi:hypothetical protein
VSPQGKDTYEYYLCVALPSSQIGSPGRKSSSGHDGVIGSGQKGEIKPWILQITVTNKKLWKKSK